MCAYLCKGAWIIGGFTSGCINFNFSPKALFPVTVFCLNCGFWATFRKFLVISKNDLEYSIFWPQAALKAAKQTRNERDEDITALHVEIQVVLKEAWICFHFLVVPCTWSDQLFSAISYSYYFLCICQNLKDDAAAAEEQRQEAEAEAKALRTMTQRMILTQEEMVCLFH